MIHVKSGWNMTYLEIMRQELGIVFNFSCYVRSLEFQDGCHAVTMWNYMCQYHVRYLIIILFCMSECY